MILQALYRLAEREGLTAYIDWQPLEICWLVRINEAGRLLNIEDCRQLPEGGKKPRGIVQLVPRQPDRQGIKAPAYFLVDNAKYVFGTATKDKSFSDEEGKEKSGWFRQIVRDCAEKTEDEAVKAVHKLLTDIDSGNQTVDIPDDCQSNHRFAFIFHSDIDRCVHERPIVKQYWEQKRLQSQTGEPIGHCLVTGNTAFEAGLFPQISKVPGPNTGSGVSLVAFNQRAFESHGWNRNENALISQGAAEMSSIALNRLLDPTFPDPHQPGQSLPRRSIRIADDTVVCYWSARNSGDGLCNIFADLMEGHSEEVGELYRSIWRGKETRIKDPSAFYALTLTGQQGRIIVRDWLESSVAEVTRNLATYFRDIDIAGNVRKQEDADVTPLGISRLMEALAQPAERRSEGVPAHLAAQFVRAALTGTPYPLVAKQRALLRFRAELGNESQDDKRKAWQTRTWNDARAAVIKAVLNRRRRAGISQLEKEVTVDMDPENRSTGYVLGQLMAVFERLQQIAMGDPNASVVDRFFSGASASPKSVFVRLYKNARHHARKARDGDSAAMAFRLERLIDQLSASFGLSERGMHPERNALPAFLNLEQQGLFVLGYHHMRRWLWLKNEDRSVWESAHPDAPDAYMWGKKEEVSATEIDAR